MRPATNRPARGFTLVELLIAIAVVAILAAIAVPTYNESVRKSRRSEAFTALAAVQQAQERWRGSNAAYTTALSDLGASSTTPTGYYGISVAAPSDAEDALRSGYIATAAAQSTQTSDTACATLAVRMLNGNLSYCGGPAGQACSWAETNACWAR